MHATVVDEVGLEHRGAGQRYFVEFSCPNTNKPLHIGHLRNDALGESLSRILATAGATVLKANLINDRGVHICKSMLAYQRYGGDSTPESAGMKRSGPCCGAGRKATRPPARSGAG
jgi:arginyl-tRNA synthetase